MTNGDARPVDGPERFRGLVEAGLLAEERLEEAAAGAAYRGVDMERILHHEYRVPKRRILEALSAYYDRPWVEYDERVPVPPELLSPLWARAEPPGRWFPVFRDGERIVIAAADPEDPELPGELEEYFPGQEYELQVALPEDIEHFTEDFLNNTPGRLVGIERTNLAMWRNNMARWRTRLACYRTDFAKVRTYLSLLRGSLGLIVIGRSLMSLYRDSPFYITFWIMIAGALPLVLVGFYQYVRIRRNVLSPPQHQTIVEVTAAVLFFLDNFQYVEKTTPRISSRKTELARLAEMLTEYTVKIDRSPDNKDRSRLAHLRNLRAAQRTIGACYRTTFARARTGLSFIRTGISFLAIGVGLMQYFGLGLLTGFDLFLVGVSVWLLVDGALWYLPARREQSEVPPYIMNPREDSLP